MFCDRQAQPQAPHRDTHRRTPPAAQRGISVGGCVRNRRNNAAKKRCRPPDCFGVRRQSNMQQNPRRIAEELRGGGTHCNTISVNSATSSACFRRFETVFGGVILLHISTALIVGQQQHNTPPPTTQALQPKITGHHPPNRPAPLGYGMTPKTPFVKARRRRPEGLRP